MGLVDLVEFRFDHDKKKFIKVATHMTNVPKALAYWEKNKRKATASRYTRFRVVQNGKLQYTNKFK